MRKQFDIATRYALAYARRRVWNAGAILGFSLLWMAVASLLLRAVGLDGSTASLALPVSVTLALGSSATIAQFMLTHPLALLFSSLVFAPVVEEIVFRLVPISLVRGAHPDKVKAVILLFSGVLFGLVHGSPYRIAAQGVLGVLLGYLYLKNGPNQYMSYFSCVAVHAAYNFTVIALQVL